MNISDSAIRPYKVEPETGRREARKCEHSDDGELCSKPTKGDKLRCKEHVEETPYAADLLRRIAERGEQ